MCPSELRDIVASQLGRTIESINLPCGTKYVGKVRDRYEQDGRMVLVTTDRVSAYDRVLGTIPFKGQVLNGITAHFFELSKDLVPNHVLAVPDPNLMVVRWGEPLKVEFVVRGYLTGSSSTSIWTAYERGDRMFCGHALPDGMQRHQQLEYPILTPSTKAPAGQHDQSMSREELIAHGWVTEEDFDNAAAMCMTLFEFGQAQAALRGLILVDTKFEVFKDPETHELFFGDEILTPDSSRYWEADYYEAAFRAGQDPRALDKEFLRLWLKHKQGWTGEGDPPELTNEICIDVALRYIELYERITGRDFIPDTEEPHQRMWNNLGLSR